MKFREWKESPQFNIFEVASRDEVTISVIRICDGKVFRMADIVESSKFVGLTLRINYFCNDGKTVLLESMAWEKTKGYKSTINDIRHKFTSPGISVIEHDYSIES